MSVSQPFGHHSDWAGPSAAPAPELMNAFQEGLPVRLISTPRRDLWTCRVDESLAAVVERNKEGFDYFPVVGARDRIIGLLDLVNIDHVAGHRGCVKDLMRPLREDDLIGADAGILRFVKMADRYPCRLVVSGAQIDGLVSLSDVQKFPARVALFALVTHLEMAMADAIRREFKESKSWKERLSDRRRSEVEEKRRVAWKDDNWVSDLLFTGFADKVTIIRKSDFGARHENFAGDMARARQLRNHLAHANDYAETRKAAAEVCNIVRKVKYWIEQLSAWSGPEAIGRG
jgi:hypothetical protein